TAPGVARLLKQLRRPRRVVLVRRWATLVVRPGGYTWLDPGRRHFRLAVQQFVNDRWTIDPHHERLAYVLVLQDGIFHVQVDMLPRRPGDVIRLVPLEPVPLGRIVYVRTLDLGSNVDFPRLPP